MAQIVGILENYSKRTSHPTLSWNIDNFDQICPEGTKKFDTIVSPTFVVEKDMEKESEWLIRMMGVEEYLFFGLYLSSSRLNDATLPIRSEWKIGYGNSVDHFCLAKDIIHNFTRTEEDGGVGYCNFIKISDLYAKREDLLQDNTLRVSVRLIIHIRGRKGKHFTSKPLQSSPLENLSEDRFSSKALFQSKLLSDVEFMCEDRIFPCHKAILFLRSQVFQAMFSQQMTEAESNKVTIEDMGSSAVEILLKYIYTGKIDLPSKDSGILIEVIYGAEKYQLTKLKNYCINKMPEVMTEENVGELIAASQMFNADEEVKEKIKTFVKERLLRLLENSEFTQVFFKYIAAFDN